MKKTRQIISIFIISLLLLTGTASADFSSLQEAINYYEEYLQDFCEKTDGWHYVDMRTSLESASKLIFFTVARDGYYEDLMSNGVNGDIATRTMQQVDSLTSEMRQALAGFNCSVAISLVKGLDEDVVLYISFNGEELTQDEPGYSYSGLVSIPNAPENIQLSEMKAYYEEQLSSFCSAHEEWTYDGVLEWSNGQVLAFRLCRDGFMKEVNQYGTQSKLVKETVSICDDFSYMLSEAFKQFRIIKPVILLDADTIEGVVFISENGVERESSENYSTLRERFGNGEPASVNSSGSSNSFTNKYGTPTTKCAHTGCNNYIATSGDTNCCPVHSRRCLNCGKYIDEDAMYCVDCIANSLGGATGSSESFTNQYGTPSTKCAYPGCNNTIASSGDTAYCSKHSNHCLNCGKLIDGDAMYCMDCISNSLTGSSSSSSGSSKKSSGNSSSSSTQRNGYDMPKDGESFSDYVKRVDPETYQAMQDQYNSAIAGGW